MEIITSRTNRWVKLAAQLKQGKYRVRYQQFLIEGIRSAEEIARCRKRDVVCFVTETALENARTTALLKQEKERNWRILRIEESLMKALSGTEHSQGILAIVPKEERRKEEWTRPLAGRYMLLDSIQDPGNMGTLIRTAAAAGCKGVYLTKGCTDPYSEKAVRSSMGSILRIPVYEELDLEDLRCLHDQAGLPWIGTALSQAKPYKENFFEEGIFVFGNEGNGIRPEVLALCDTRVYIPMSGDVESLNVTAAAAIILFYYA